MSAELAHSGDADGDRRRVLSGLDRIAIVGTTGSGKSTLAEALSELTGAVHVELDGLNHRPNWEPTPIPEFRARLLAVAEQGRWIVDGNYVAHTSEIVWPRAQLVVWLDLPLGIVVWRIVRRSVLRIVRRTELWHGNRETWRMLFSRSSIVLWAIRSHGMLRRDLPVRLSPPALAGVPVVRLTRPREVEAWLAEAL